MHDACGLVLRARPGVTTVCPPVEGDQGAKRVIASTSPAATSEQAAQAPNARAAQGCSRRSCSGRKRSDRSCGACSAGGERCGRCRSARAAGRSAHAPGGTFAAAEERPVGVGQEIAASTLQRVAKGVGQTDKKKPRLAGLFRGLAAFLVLGGTDPWRRGWDSNPRYGDTVRLISSQVHSTTLPPLRSLVFVEPAILAEAFCDFFRAAAFRGRPCRAAAPPAPRSSHRPADSSPAPRPRCGRPRGPSR